MEWKLLKVQEKLFKADKTDQQNVKIASNCEKILQILKKKLALFLSYLKKKNQKTPLKLLQIF